MEMTLDQIGLMLAQESNSVPKKKRTSFQCACFARLLVN
jgi:hypothetical protein